MNGLAGHRSHQFIKSVRDIIKSLGVVFGDIGTSPIYTLSVIFSIVTYALPPTAENVVGVLSLIIWTLFILVTLAYSWLAMSLGKKGEGGTVVLKEILQPLVKKPSHKLIVTALSFVGIALFFGDGVITPAVSILSAVEGLKLLSWCSAMPTNLIVFLASIITIFLFVLQRRGTEQVSVAFGPLMVVWFFILAATGAYSIIQEPIVLQAFNPLRGIIFLFKNGFTGFFVLSGVILSATGGEALYADMGHLGRKPIIRAWHIVFVALLLSYLGQGSYLLRNQFTTGSVLYRMILDQIPGFLSVPFLILSLFATVIASQAMISGIFSIVYQGIITGILPLLKVDYTSNKLRSQVYIGTINWFLMISVLFMIFIFKNSQGLASAYGLAVTGTMTVTGIMMTWIFFLRRHYYKVGLGIFIIALDFMYFCANLMKIPNGGYWPLIIASIPLSLIFIYNLGKRRLTLASQPQPLDIFLPQYEQIYDEANKIDGSALFFVKNTKAVQAYVVQTLFKNNIIYQDNILITVITRDDPFGVIGFFKGDLAPGFRIFEIHMGYMEILDIEKILHNAGIEPKVMFYGMDEIITKNIIWQIYALIKRLSPSFVQFYKLPANKLHGVVNSVEV